MNQIKDDVSVESILAIGADLTHSQIAAYAVELPELQSAEGRSETVVQIARRLGIGKTIVREAMLVKKYDADMFNQIKLGQKSTTTAVNDLHRCGAISRHNNGWPKGKKRGQGPKTIRLVAEIRRFAESGYTTDQIAAETNITAAHVRVIATREKIHLTADAVQQRSRRLDVNRIITGTVDSANAALVGIELIDGLTGDIDYSQLKHWTVGLNRAIRHLVRLKRQLQTLKRNHNNEPKENSNESKIATGTILGDED